jgi:hypothetical protein
MYKTVDEIESGPPADLEITQAPGLMPNLSEWGIEEIERGVCEDSYENRQTIKQNKGKWQVVFDTNGMPTGYIQVITAEMYQAALGMSKSNLLTDPDDYNSDYLSGLKLLLADGSNELAPTWVLNTTRTYMRQQEEKRNLGADADLHQSRLVDIPKRCGVTKADGTRCWGWSRGTTESLGMCAAHAARTTRKSTGGLSLIQAARNRLISAMPGMVDILEDIAMNSSSDAVRVQAINSMADRAGLRGGFELEEKVEVTVTESKSLVADRLKKLREGHVKTAEMKKMFAAPADPEDKTEPVDAEVVEDDE